MLGVEEKVYNVRDGRLDIMDLAGALSREAPATAAECRQVLWAAMMAEKLGAASMAQDPGDLETGEKVLNRIRDRVAKHVLGGALPYLERAEAGKILAHLGDPRKEVMTVEHMSFCYVPAGPFLMGSNDDDPDAYDDEKPRREVDIPYPYWISTFPVTQAQYARFVEARGYTARAYWTEAGWSQKTESEWSNREPYEPVFQLENHPVVGVSWYEAYAFTQWLTAHLQEQHLLPEGWIVSLPTEPEWEKAARGGLEVPVQPVLRRLSEGLVGVDCEMEPHPLPAQIYSWGNEWEFIALNIVLGRTTSSGCFAIGKSRYDVQDMLGNVDEWTQDQWSSLYPVERDEQNLLSNPQGDSSRVMRGGSFEDFEDECRCAVRVNFHPNLRSKSIGFRIVLHPPA